MLKFYISILLSFCIHKVQAALLVWPDYPAGKLYRIDTKRQIVEVESQSGLWAMIGRANLVGVIEADFPPTIRVKAFEIDKDRYRYLLVDCTQQVYRFDRQSLTLERIDRTYFRGYNCYSTKFYRKDTLYSFGGYGFWRSNSFQTYYRNSSRGWELIVPNNNDPASFCFGFTGYFPSTDQFITGMHLQQQENQKKNSAVWEKAVYAYSFVNHEWTKLGDIPVSILKHIQTDLINRLSWFQSGTVIILKHFEAPFANLLLVDPIKNEVRLWKDVPRLLPNIEDNFDTDIYRVYTWKDTLYLHPIENATVSNPTLLKLSVPQLWKEAEVIGPFYEPAKTVNSYLLTVGFCALLGGGLYGLWYYRKRKIDSNKPIEINYSQEVPILESFTDQEKNLLIAFTKQQLSEGITTEQLNQLLGIADKTPDNQRKIRSESLKVLNMKIKMAYGIDEAIERKPTELDRRMFTYVLKQAMTEKVELYNDSSVN